MFDKVKRLRDRGEHARHLGMSLVLLLAMAFALGACNTMRGLGQDVGAAGGAVEDTAEDVQD